MGLDPDLRGGRADVGVDRQSRPVAAEPTGPPGVGPTPKPAPPTAPTVRVTPIDAHIVDAAPTSGIPLTAPPLRIHVVVAFGDARVHGNLPVSKKEP